MAGEPSEARAMLLERPAPAASGPLRAVAREPQPPAPGMLLVRVAACGVCRTDLQICEGDLAARALPIVPGHQAVGRVEAVGAGVTDWRAGDRAGVAWLASTCGVCDKCTSGRENLCARATFTGWDSDGGYATHIAVRADFALRIPDGFDDVAAAPLLCGGVIGFRSLERSGIAPGGRLGLYGFGASALITMQIARHWGCRVFVATRSTARARARDRAGRRVDRRLRRRAAGAAGRGDHVHAVGRRRARRPARARSRRHRRDQRHPPGPPPRAALRRAVVGAPHRQRRQLHARRRAPVPGARRDDPRPHRHSKPTRSPTPTPPSAASRAARSAAPRCW